jgi:hypothetical protein
LAAYVGWENGVAASRFHAVNARVTCAQKAIDAGDVMAEENKIADESI